MTEQVDDIFSYLESLENDAIDRLYNSDKGEHAPWACQAVLQALPALAKQYIMRLLPVDGWERDDFLLGWIQDRYSSSHESAIQQLVRLRVLQKQKQNGQRVYRLNPLYAKSLQQAMTGAAPSPWHAHKGLVRPEKKVVTLERLHKHTADKWGAVLHFLAGSTAMPDPPAQVVVFLVQTGLMREDEGNSDVFSITNKGYEFMLKDTHTQVWMTIQNYLEMRPKWRDAILALLFQLAFCHAGEDYPKSGLTETQQQVLTEFSNFGLIYQRKISSTRFYPTPLGINLIFGSSAGPLASKRIADEQGSVFSMEPDAMLLIVQTNYQVTAYTSSSLHIAMLSLFVELRLRLQNVVIGAITRESIQRALDTGISARQILAFMKSHAHHVVSSRLPVIPENISDQILLWEREKTRISFDSAIILDLKSTSPESFEHIHEAVQKYNACLWANAEKGKIAVRSNKWNAALQRIVQDIILGIGDSM